MQTEVMKPKDGKLVAVDEFTAIEDALGLKIHPFARKFPRVTGPAYDALVKDVKENGVRIPIAVQGGMLLDGITRVSAAIDAKRKVEDIAKYELDPDKSAVEFIASANVHRRHLTDKQRTELAAVMAEAFKVEMAERSAANLKKGAATPTPPLGGVGKKGSAVEQAAKALNVKSRSVERARKKLGLAKPRKPSSKSKPAPTPEQEFVKLYAKLSELFGSVSPGVRRQLVFKLRRDYPAAFKEHEKE